MRRIVIKSCIIIVLDLLLVLLSLFVSHLLNSPYMVIGFYIGIISLKLADYFCSTYAERRGKL